MKNWSCQFVCDKSIYEMEPILNRSGSLKWYVRDCHWYPDYLQSRFDEDLRICIYQEGPLLHCLVESRSGSDLDRSLIDGTLLPLLEKIPVQSLTETQPVEWPFD